MKTYHIAIPLLSNDVTLSWPLNYLRLVPRRDVQGVAVAVVGGEDDAMSVLLPERTIVLVGVLAGGDEEVSVQSAVDPVLALEQCCPIML